ncbi:MAG: TetR/AcrR family transcriptional regulator [Ilumatobacteraceae bacterium]
MQAVRGVTATYPGSGDARRSLELLWNGTSPAQRGPRPSLDLDTIVALAMELADAGGLSAVSMRAIAERLGRSAMSLYTYVPGKAELLDLMHDRALGELMTQTWTGRTWRAGVETSVRDLWGMYERHPWMLQISDARASLGPHSLQIFEAQVTLFDDTELTGVEITRLVGAVQLLVQGAARVVAEARDAARVTGQTDDDWWAERSAAMGDVVSDEVFATRYPTLSRMTQEHVFEQLDRAPDDETGYLERDALVSFEFGLRALLDGVERLIAARRR